MLDLKRLFLSEKFEEVRITEMPQQDGVERFHSARCTDRKWNALETAKCNTMVDIV